MAGVGQKAALGAVGLFGSPIGLLQDAQERIESHHPDDPNGQGKNARDRFHQSLERVVTLPGIVSQ